MELWAISLGAALCGSGMWQAWRASRLGQAQALAHQRLEQALEVARLGCRKNGEDLLVLRVALLDRQAIEEADLARGRLQLAQARWAIGRAPAGQAAPGVADEGEFTLH